MAASGPAAATLAGETGDGPCTVAPQAELVETFREAGGSGPRYGQATVCWAANEDEANQIGPDQEGFFDFFERELAPRL